MALCVRSNSRRRCNLLKALPGLSDKKKALKNTLFCRNKQEIPEQWSESQWKVIASLHDRYAVAAARAEQKPVECFIHQLYIFARVRGRNP